MSTDPRTRREIFAALAGARLGLIAQNWLAAVPTATLLGAYIGGGLYRLCSRTPLITSEPPKPAG